LRHHHAGCPTFRDFLKVGTTDKAIGHFLVQFDLRKFVDRRSSAVELFAIIFFPARPVPGKSSK